MKTKIILFLTAAAMIAFAESRPLNDAGAAAQLEKHIGELEARIKSLESRLQKLEPAKNPPLAYTPFQKPGVPLPHFAIAPAANGASGKIWGEGRVNGWNFYTIPCADGTRTRAE